MEQPYLLLGRCESAFDGKARYPKEQTMPAMAQSL
jgi:hypothetical protein